MLRYVVEEVGMITPTTLGLSLKVQKPGATLRFRPGQYAAISFRRHGRPTAARCFSVASASTDGDILQFGIRVGGKFTTALTQITPGSIVDVRGPFGSFVIDPTAHKRVVLCAGGIGITPFMSMLRTHGANTPDMPLALVYSVRGAEDIAFKDELCKIVHDNKMITAHVAISSGVAEPISDLKTYSGRVNPDVLRGAAGDELGKTTFFICGPPAFMKATLGMLGELGVPGRSIITEAFSQSHGRQTSKVRGWPINLYALGALGTAATSVTLMASDLLKSIPPTLLPETLSSSKLPAASNNRQRDLDTMINELQKTANASPASPSVTAANKEVSDAEAKIAEVNAQNAINSGTTYVATTRTTTTSSSSSATQASTPTPAPKPAPTPAPAPVCTTSASGVTTCR